MRRLICSEATVTDRQSDGHARAVLLHVVVDIVMWIAYSSDLLLEVGVCDGDMRRSMEWNGMTLSRSDCEVRRFV